MDLVEAELVQGTPNLESEIGALFDDLKQNGINSRALTVSFAEKHTVMSTSGSACTSAGAGHCHARPHWDGASGERASHCK